MEKKHHYRAIAKSDHLGVKITKTKYKYNGKKRSRKNSNLARAGQG